MQSINKIWAINTSVYGFFTPLNFHEFHKLFWICEIKFMKCCKNIIAILVAVFEISGENTWIREILKMNIQFLRNPWKYTSMK